MRHSQGKTVPGFWRRLWEGWKRVAKKIGNFQARVILMILYFVVLAPLGFAFHWAADPLEIKPGAHPGWHPRGDEKGSPRERAQRQS